jgi:hypothetical protein
VLTPPSDQSGVLFFGGGAGGGERGRTAATRPQDEDTEDIAAPTDADQEEAPRDYRTGDFNEYGRDPAARYRVPT